MGYKCEVPDEERYHRLHLRNAKKRAVCSTTDVTCEIIAGSEGSNIVSREGEGGNIEVLDGSDGRSYESTDTVEVDNTGYSLN